MPVTVRVAARPRARTRCGSTTTRAYGPDLDRIVLGGTGAPAGWTIEPADPVTTPELGPGQSLRATWTVTPPAAAAPGATSPWSVGSTTRRSRWSCPARGWSPATCPTSSGSTPRASGARSSATCPTARRTAGDGKHDHDRRRELRRRAWACTRRRRSCSTTPRTAAGSPRWSASTTRRAGTGRSTFQVWADSRKVADSGVVTWQDAAKPIDANIGNSEIVRLVVARRRRHELRPLRLGGRRRSSAAGASTCRAASAGRCRRRSRSRSARRPSARSRRASTTPTRRRTTASVTSTAGDAALVIHGRAT